MSGKKIGSRGCELNNVLCLAIYTNVISGDSADKLGGPIFAYILLAASYITRMRIQEKK